jgi:hypothetical protein
MFPISRSNPKAQSRSMRSKSNVHDTLLCILTRCFMGRHNQTFSKPQDYCRSRNVRIEREFSQPIPKSLAFPLAFEDATISAWAWELLKAPVLLAIGNCFCLFVQLDGSQRMWLIPWLVSQVRTRTTDSACSLDVLNASYSITHF